MWSSILTWAVLSAPLVWEVLSDYNEWRKEKRDKKREDVAIRGCLMGVAAVINTHLIDPSVMAWQGFMLSAGIFIFHFDYIMGYLLTKNPFFLGTTSQTDIFLKSLSGLLGLFGRGILFAIGIFIYYFY